MATITALADCYTVYWDSLTSDWSTTQNVMSNDLNLTTSVVLWSVDDGTQNQTTLKPAYNLTDMDLYTQDAIGVDNVSSGGSMHLTGGQVQIDSRTGLITYHITIGSALYNYMVGLAAGQTYVDTFTYAIRYANALTASQATVTITLVGANDVPTIGGTATGSVKEDTAGQTTANGMLTISDPDSGQSYFQTPAASSLNGTYGAFTFNATTGAWTYTLDHAKADSLSEGQQVHDKLTVTSADGTASQQIDVAVTGTNDAPVVSGAVTASVNEDGVSSTLDALANASDVDAGTMLGVVNVPGSLPAGVSYNAATHSFTLDPANAAYQSLAQGATTTVTVNYDVSDGITTTPGSVKWTVTGVNDPAVIAGQDTGSVTEATSSNPGTPTVTGTLTVSDPDTGQSSFVAQNNVATTYGHFTLATGGGWTYTLDNSNATVDALNNGQTLTDTVTVNSADGTSHSVNITINGATDSTDLGGPTGISFNLNPTINGSNVSNLGTFVATGDPDAGDIFTWSVGAGSSSGFDVTGGVLNANSVAAGDSTLNLVVTDKAGNSFSQTYHVWIGTSAANTKTFALASNNNIGDGLAGGDSLIGGSGLDYLVGAAGDDTFQGNGGADQFVGGSGSDHFVYAASGDSTNTAFDTILDFASGTDRIDFKSALGLTNNDGNLGAATTLAAHHVGWKSVGSDAIVYANTGTASAPIASSQVMEIHLTGVSSLNANDFNLSA